MDGNASAGERSFLWTDTAGGRAVGAEVLLLPAGVLAFYALPGLGGVAVALLAFAALAFSAPFAALLAILAALPLHFRGRQPVGPIDLSLPDALLLACCAGLLAGAYWRALLGGWSALSAPLWAARRSPYWWPALLLLGLATISLLFPSERRAERLVVGLRAYSLLVEPIAVYALVRLYCPVRAKLWLALDVLFAGAMLVTLWGLGEAAWYAVAPPENVGGYHRVRSLFNHPNTLGLYLSRVLPLFGALAVALPSGRRRQAYLGGAALMGLVALLAGSRGSWLALAAAAAVTAALLGRFRWLVPAAAIPAAGLGLLALSGQNRLSSLLSPGRGSAETRRDVWRAAVDEIGRYPLRGNGLGNVGWMRRYTTARQRGQNELVDAHNIVLDFWTKLGVLGVAAIFWLLATYVRLAIRGVRARDASVRALAVALLAAMTGALVHGLVDAFYFGLPFAVLFWFFLGATEVLDPSHAD